ncbi:unnamed protein product [Cuscuta epithymum]|uniref:FBD domain-containing protein n=1 Tax=Cuscuta epithymum TaxID=186058 RepID=A0AAV0ELJ6_9ASTE|nr:unnamed protein product [Cuscuta epithymum]
MEEERRDVTLQLPADVKDRILEGLDTRDAARTSVLATHWKGVWPRHGKLVFDPYFFTFVPNNPFKVISDILASRAGPVKKFELQSDFDPIPPQSDLDRWGLFLSTNGLEELNISLLARMKRLVLPAAIFSCPTLRVLYVEGLVCDCPNLVNGQMTLPCAVSMGFESVIFRSGYVKGDAVSIAPELEKLFFNDCFGVNGFLVNAPKLVRLSVTGSELDKVQTKWIMPHLTSIQSLTFSITKLWCEDVAECIPTFPTAINLDVINLYGFDSTCEKCVAFVMTLIKKSPNLRQLHISGALEGVFDDWGTERETAEDSKVLEGAKDYMANLNLNMLENVKLNWFGGNLVEMYFVKALLLGSPALDKVVIQLRGRHIDQYKLQNQLLKLPRASEKAQIVFK